MVEIPDTAAGTWLDVSRPLANGIPVWPGDRPFRVETRHVGKMVLTSFETTCHVGTHVDAPLHMEGRGSTVDALPINLFLGTAEVVDARRAARRVGLGDLPEGWIPRAPRVLLRTRSQPLEAVAVREDLSGLDVGLVHFLADRDVLLVGTDSPSVDPFDSTGFEAHHALAKRGLTWIEGLNLEAAEPGLYTLVALPLALVGTEAAPVRAILKKL